MLGIINMFEQFFMTAIIVTAIFGAVLGITGCANKADAEVVVPDEEKTMIVLPQHEDVYATYNVPLDYDLQLYIIQTCEELNIDAAVVMAMIFYESSYQADAIGDGGESLGLMQIKPRYHADRMERLDVTNLLHPYQNVTVGIDFLAELLDEYDGNVEMALMAYNAGRSGAEEYWFSNGEYSNEYSQKVTELARLLNGGGVVG
jgi:soluble lytic murein transglycosylase-like protein